MAEVTITANGAPVNEAPNNKLALTLPRRSGRPATSTTFSVNPMTGKWVEEGGGDQQRDELERIATAFVVVEHRRQIHRHQMLHQLHGEIPER
jgi:hypothetical protein